MCSESHEIERFVNHDRGHAGPTVSTWNGHTVNARLANPSKAADRLRYFQCCDVFALPAECVADPIHEIEVAALVGAHEIAGTKPRVARLEHVAENLLFRIFRARVTLEPAADVGSILQKLA